jgi:putative endonuclease
MLAWLKDVWQRWRNGSPGGEGARSGRRGEAAAADFLQRRHGYSVVARNWRSPRDRRQEIDLVARDGDVLVFVEVKARAVGALVPGFETIDRRKRKVLCGAVHAYLSALENPPRTFRFDVVEVTLSEHLPSQCHHFENVALFPKGYHVARQSGSLAPFAGGDGPGRGN